MVARALMTVMTVAGPVLVVGLIVGLLVSLFQATTQLQDATLSFIPKIVVTFLTLVLLGPWMVRVLLNFTTELLGGLERVIGL
jgi:flagellar biosynthetic protein FliQ